MHEPMEATLIQITTETNELSLSVKSLNHDNNLMEHLSYRHD